MALTATASDSATGSGLGSVDFQVRATAGGSYASVSIDSNAPYATSWNATGIASGSYDLRVVVTDLAGNVYTSGATTVNVDSTAPLVTLADPG